MPPVTGKLRVCLIGCGGMSTNAHGPSLALYARNVSQPPIGDGTITITQCHP
jgi:hypothetical protein